MKRVIALAVTVVLGLTLGALAAQPASACEEGQVARVHVQSETLGEVDPALSGVSVEVWSSDQNDAPVSVSALAWDGSSGLACSDPTVNEAAEDPVGFAEGWANFILAVVGSLLP